MQQRMFIAYKMYAKLLCISALFLFVILDFSVLAVASISPAERLLLDKAQFWSAQGKPDMAVKVLKKLLINIPDSAEGRLQLGLIEVYQGHKPAARHQLELLRQQHPGNRRITRLEYALSKNLGKNDMLKRARELAQQHKTQEAVAEYNKFFDGKKPHGDIAFEYYQVASGLPDYWSRSKQGLEKLLRSHPENIKYKLALAKLLTYRGNTRKTGIRMLRSLSDSAAGSSIKTEARQQWKQALLWMPVRKSSVPAYKDYLHKTGPDVEVSNLIQQAGKVRLSVRDRKSKHIFDKRKQAFLWMDKGKTHQAEKAFRALLRINRNDADSNAGLGLVLLRQKKYSPAVYYLERASRLNPRKATQWTGSLNLAHHEAVLEEVKALEKRGDVNGAIKKLVRAQRLYPSQRAVWTLEMAHLQNKYNLRTDALASALRHLKANPYKRENSQLFIDVYQESSKNTNNRVLLGRAISALETAVYHKQNNNWLRLNLARLYQFQGSGEKAISLLNMIVKLNPHMYEAYYTRALFFSQLERWSEAYQSIRTIPKNRRSIAMRQLSQKIDSHVRISRAKALAQQGRRHEAIRMLEPLTAKVNRDNIYLIAKAWKDIGELDRALRITNKIIKKQSSNDYGLKLFYASLLSDSKYYSDADIWLQNLKKQRSRMIAAERKSLDLLERGSAIRKSDQLSQQGKYADAWEQLAPYLLQKPVNSEVLLALTRIYGSAGRDKDIIPVYNQLLKRNPDNLGVLEAYAKTAIDNHKYDTALKLINRGISLRPTSQRFYALKGDLEKSRGDYKEAVNSYSKAKKLNSQRVMAAGVGQQTVFSSQGLRNPFLKGTRTIQQNRFAVASEPSGLMQSKASLVGIGLDAAGGASTPTEVNSLDDRIAAVRSQRSTRIAAAVDIHQRTGEQGLGLLSDIETPVRVHFALDSGYAELQLTPVLLSAGSLDLRNTGRASRFGSNSINTPLPQNRSVQQSDSGMAIHLRYANALLHADVGVSPLGFTVTNFIGGLGIKLHPQKYMHLGLDASRRSMTDSLLSYAGLVDQPTGLKWGGVVRNQASLSFGYDDPVFGLYGGLGMALLTGRNVASNTSLSLYAGGYSVMSNSDTMKTTVGFDIRALGYRRNLSKFTFGHGGYFSPQQYASAAIPLSLDGRKGKLAYNFNVHLGIQSFQEDTTPYFPNNPFSQGVSGKFFPAIRKTGVLFGLKSAIEYQLSPRITTGALLELDNAQKFTVYNIGAYIKYSFSPTLPRFDFNISPLRGYYLEGFR